MRLREEVDELASPDQALSEYVGRPFDFFREVFDITGWSKMREMVDAYEDPDIEETWVAACHGVSKTMSYALLAEYHVNVMGYPCVTTAPTLRQCNDLIWQQMRDNRERAKERVILPGRILDSTPNMKGGVNRCWAFVPKTQDSSQGIHLDNLLVIVDEAAGVPDWLWKAIVGWVTNPGCQLVGIANPNTHLSYFRSQFFELRGKTNPDGKLISRAIEISAHDSPNVTTWECGRKKTEDELEVLERPIPALASDKWLEKCAREWGRDSLDYWMKALGKWPDSVSEERAIPMTWILAGFARTDAAIRDGRLDPDAPMDKIAVDVARKGSDFNCRGSLRLRYVQVDRYWNEPDTTKTDEDIHHTVSEAEPKPVSVAIDGNAVGGGVVDNANKNKRNHPKLWGRCEVIEIDWGATPTDEKRKRKRKKRSTKEQHTLTVVAALYYKLRRALDPSRPEEDLLYLPTEESLRRAGLTRDQYAAQLNARKCWWDEFNRFHVESKSKLKERTAEMKGATSCDAGDMTAMLMETQKQKRGLRFASSKRR